MAVPQLFEPFVQLIEKPVVLTPLMASAVARRASHSALTEMATAERVSIRLDRTFPWEVDGGEQDRTDRFDVTCVPLAVRICQPRGQDAP